MLMQQTSPQTSLRHHKDVRRKSGHSIPRLRRSQTTFETLSRHKPNLDPELQEEIARFAEEKKQFVIRTSSYDEEAWREAIRVQLEEELDQRVREALHSPSQERQNRKNSRDQIDSDLVYYRNAKKYKGRKSAEEDDEIIDKRKEGDVQKLERLNSHLTFDQSKRDQRLTQKQWQILEAERKLRRFLKNRPGQAPKSTELSAPDYVMDTDLLQYGGRRSPGADGNGHSFFGNLSRGIKSHSHYAQVSKKAEANFGSLTTVERFEFFYAFTKNGFKEAMQLGRFPDGSELMQNDKDKYVDRYGIVRDEHGPFWPHENGPLFGAPAFLKNGFPRLEPVTDTQIPEKFRQTVDNQPTHFTQKWRGVQIIFDSEKSGRNYEPLALQDHSPSLYFESRFESGNLRQARRIGEFEYELVLKTDLYTQRHTQWYYFKVARPLPGVTYKFKIVNLLKKTSLYNYGMRPLLYSEQLASAKNFGWYRAGHHISYYKNEHNLHCPLLSRERTHYVLEWQMEFPNAEDTYYVAHCYPYTFTDLKDDLENLLHDADRSKVMKREVMCETKAGNSCFLVTVTNFNDSSSQSEKKGIVVTARVHPGETNSSWMMKGLLDFITGKTPCAKELRNRYIFKIVPMLNPDGVIVGNYRCSLAARDLNRNYRRPRRENFPTIWHTKYMLEQFSKEHEVMIYCDLHGHSRKQNVFMYGCNTSDNKQVFAGAIPFTPTESFLKERLFPWLMAQKAPDKFSFRGCRFTIRKCKESTGRVVMYRQMNVLNSFTMEATFCGTNICRGDRRHFNMRDFEAMGRNFCEVVLEYGNTQHNAAKQTELVLDMTRAVAQQVLESRGLLPNHLPDFTTEKGRDQLKERCTEEGEDFCKERKGLSHSEQYAFAFMNLVKKERDNITRAVNQKPSSSSHPEGNSSTNRSSGGANATELSKLNLNKLLDLMSGESGESYVEILENLRVEEDIDNNGSESSSDSDSESEPEMVYTEQKIRRKKKKHKKHKSSSERPSAVGHENKKKQPKEDRPSSTSALPTISSKVDSGKKRSDQISVSSKRDSQFAKQFPGFVNKYVGRSNGGIPCFSEERLMERASKRMEEMRKRMEEEQGFREEFLRQRGDQLFFVGDVYESDNVQGGPTDGEPKAFVSNNRRVSYPQPVDKSTTVLDIRSQFQQSIQKGVPMHIRTGYMHGSTTSPTAISHTHPPTDSSDEEDSDPDFAEVHAHRQVTQRHPVAVVHSPYGNLSPGGLTGGSSGSVLGSGRSGTSGNTAGGASSTSQHSGHSKAAAAATSPSQGQLSIIAGNQSNPNLSPTKISSLLDSATEIYESHCKASIPSIWKTREIVQRSVRRLRRRKGLPPLSQRLAHANTFVNNPPTSAGAAAANTDNADSCSIPLRHTNANIMVTPRSSVSAAAENLVVMSGTNSQGGKAKASGSFPKEHVHTSANHAAQTTGLDTMKPEFTDLLFSKLKNYHRANTSVQINNTSSSLSVQKHKHRWKQSERHATCE